MTAIRAYDSAYSRAPVAFGPAEIAMLRSRSPRMRRRWWIVLLLTTAVFATALSVVLVNNRSHSGVDHPKEWDPRVKPYVEIVETARGLEFEHPVHVDFLGSQEFRDQLMSRSPGTSRADTREILRTEDLLRSLGLVSGDLDLFDDLNRMRGSAVIGYYSYAEERISLRATELTPAFQAVLVRELTHALEDQSFDTGSRLADLDADPTRRTAFLTLLKGDAARVETAWRDSLSPEALEALEEDTARLDDASEGAEGVPMALKMMADVPVEFGEALLAVVVEGRGERAIDDLFLTPPTTQEQILDPWTLVKDGQGSLDVRKPPLESGEHESDEGTLGAIFWLVVLAERLPMHQALEAADGWGGDAYVAFDRDERGCVRAAFAADTPRDLAQMNAALRDWVRAAPVGSASVGRTGALLELESCAPRPAVTAAANAGSRDAVSLAVARSHLSVGLARTGVEVPDARCGAARLARVVPLEQLRALDLETRRVRRGLTACRA